MSNTTKWCTTENRIEHFGLVFVFFVVQCIENARKKETHIEAEKEYQNICVACNSKT